MSRLVFRQSFLLTAKPHVTGGAPGRADVLVGTAKVKANEKTAHDAPVTCENLGPLPSFFHE
jgi:hypothetical protein